MRKLRDNSKNEQPRNISKSEQSDEIIISTLLLFEIRQSPKNSKRMLEINEAIQTTINAVIQMTLTIMMQTMSTSFSRSSRLQKPQNLQKPPEKININEKIAK